MLGALCLSPGNHFLNYGSQRSILKPGFYLLPAPLLSVLLSLIENSHGFNPLSLLRKVLLLICGAGTTVTTYGDYPASFGQRLQGRIKDVAANVEEAFALP